MKPIAACFSLFLISVSVYGQENNYAKPVEALYRKADSAVTEAYVNSRTKVNEDTFSFNDIVIAYPQCEESPVLRNVILGAQAVPFAIPSLEEMDNPAVELRNMADSWGGVLMPDGWVKAGDEYSLLVYKAVADRNIPYIGVSDLSVEIDAGLRRKSEKVADINELVRKAIVYRHAKELMSGIFTLDSHSDLPGRYHRPGYSVGHRNFSQTSVPKMDEGGLDAQVLVSFLDQGPEDAASLEKAAQLNLHQIEEIKADIEKYSAICGFARNRKEAEALKKQGKKAFFIALENGYGLGGNLANVKKMADLGICYISLCHFYDNNICHTSAVKTGADPSKGLTDFGRKVIAQMNKYGIMIDLSHPSEGTFWDCIKYSKDPIICSHSGAKAIYGHDRGLTDAELRALAKNGGVIQLYTVNNFLGPNPELSDVDLFMKHFNHCVEIAGEDHVGIGSDFDGGGGILGCNGDNDLINLTVKMIEHGYTDTQIEKFWGGNFLRVMDEVQKDRF